MANAQAPARTPKVAPSATLSPVSTSRVFSLAAGRWRRRDRWRAPSRAARRGTPEDIATAVGRRHDIDRTVLIQVGHLDHRTNPGPVVNQLRHEPRAARCFRIPNRLEPIEDGCSLRVRIAITVEMRPRAFAGNDV